MELKDVGTVMDILKATYPQFYLHQSNEQRKTAVKLWASMLADEPAELVLAAVKAYIATEDKGFPPSVGQIKAKIRSITTPKSEEMTEAEAWSLVQRALSNGLYGAKNEFDALPEMIQRIVGSPNQIREWAMMDVEVVHSVVSSNFQRSYRARMESEREYAALPSDVKRYMAEIAEGFAFPELGDRGPYGKLR